MKVLNISSALALALMLSTSTGFAELTVALFVTNNELNVTSDNVKSLQNLISSKLGSSDFKILEQSLMVDSVSTALKQPNLLDGDIELYKNLRDSLVGKPAKELTLADSSSTLNLARNLGANAILSIAINSFSVEKRKFSGNDIAPKAVTTVICKLNCTYKIAYTESGGVAEGGSVNKQKAWRESAAFTLESSGVIDELLRDCSQQIVDEIKAKKPVLKAEPTSEGYTLTIIVKPTLPGGGALQVPVFVNDKVELKQSMGVKADIVVDGITNGNSAELLSVSKGLHQLEVIANGFKKHKKTINMRKDMKLSVDLEMTAESYQQWKATIEEMQLIGAKSQYLAADIERIKATTKAMEDAGLIYINNGSEEILIQK